jgi:hypothetical protein
MTSAPLCPKHGVAMRQYNNPEGIVFKCPRLISKWGVEPKVFCQERSYPNASPEAPAPGWPQPATTATPPPSQAPLSAPDSLLATEALAFAGEVFQGSSQGMDALNLARDAYQFLLNPGGEA